ncbi:hypothetical protein H9Q08_03380 [Chryseobacterium sp. PS-8]|uniref:Uncharacterized protein n=1 Tax=Chryseobacterium indicum TaxID=2766954 RepID=A0ABS9C1H5_9FLAO|nr:hypothetical protein [Chryseobacterium sp. PS-8]MCF2218336.1 hypothetical protein [Chryseobacterium sp. PS-8]
MKVKIYDVENQVDINAKIVEAKDFKGNLPSITDNWRFSFNKLSIGKNTRTYVLVAEHSDEVIEGCLIFKMLEGKEPYMAYIEIAPHNKGNEKQYDKIAGCLIAFASRLSFIHGKEYYTGYLTFHVSEESEEDQIKLMALYSKKYYAIRFAETDLMIIKPEDGEKLIEFYLNK